MCRDSIFSTEIYRSGLKFTLHNPETFFNPRPDEILERFNCQTTDTLYFIKRQPKQLKIKQ